MKSPRGVTRFPGITVDAKALNVDRAHLYRVLSGARQSKSLQEKLTKIGEFLA